MSGHQPELDNFTPAQIRVVCEQLLFTMDYAQREKFMATFPGLYVKLYPGTIESAISKFTEQTNDPSVNPWR